MKSMILTVFFLLSTASAFAQVCYVDMVHTPTNRVVRSFTAYGDPNTCVEGMKECRKSIRLEYSSTPSYPNGSLDCVRAGDYGPTPTPNPYPTPTPNPYPPTYSCGGLTQGGLVYEISTGTYKTARIIFLDCMNRYARIEFYGSWSGAYDVNTSSLVPQNGPGNSCYGMSQGSNVYETSTGTYKTARIVILDCMNNYARIEFYGRWSGAYDVNLRSLVPQNGPANSCFGMTQGSLVWEITTGTYKTARILILDCMNNYAQIEFYGRWSGVYNVNTRDLIPQR